MHISVRMLLDWWKTNYSFSSLSISHFSSMLQKNLKGSRVWEVGVSCLVFFFCFCFFLGVNSFRLVEASVSACKCKRKKQKQALYTAPRTSTKSPPQRSRIGENKTSSETHSVFSPPLTQVKLAILWLSAYEWNGWITLKGQNKTQKWKYTYLSFCLKCYLSV